MHGCFASQLPDVLGTVYGGVPRTDLVLLELADGQPVVVEDLGAGAFPHLYAELTPAAVRRAFDEPEWKGLVPAGS